jgi:tRNA modification GTPase
VVELQCHGSPVIVDWLLEVCCSLGARSAAPGEFSLRAFLNDKLDLTQAEAIADLIASTSRAQATAAGRSLSGEFSARVTGLQTGLTRLRVLCESWLDFPDEDIDHAAIADLRESWARLDRQAATLEQQAALGRRLSDGLTVALAGLPNAGKSSLLNRLAGTEAAIVTEVPGTTRDTIREAVDLGGIVVTLIDMAGLRATADRVEGEGIRRAQREIAAADHVLWVADVAAGIEAAQRQARHSIPPASGFTLVLNKIDLLDGESAQFDDDGPVFALSAATGAGIDTLRAHLRALAGFDDGSRGSFSARRRHIEALTQARAHIAAAGPLLDSGLELAAEELAAAQSRLSQLTGELTSDDLLGEIFSSFCIGK